MDVHLFTSRESADTLVRLNILFKSSRWTGIMWDGIIAFTHAGFAAGSGWCVMPFGFGSFCYVSEQLLFRTRAFSVLSQLPATQAAETVRTTGMENASSKRYCHPSRELFRAGDLLFFRFITQ
jgi:hypothetical protein